MPPHVFAVFYQPKFGLGGVPVTSLEDPCKHLPGKLAVEGWLPLRCCDQVKPLLDVGPTRDPRFRQCLDVAQAEVSHGISIKILLGGDPVFDFPIQRVWALPAGHVLLHVIWGMRHPTVPPLILLEWHIQG